MITFQNENESLKEQDVYKIKNIKQIPIEKKSVKF